MAAWRTSRGLAAMFAIGAALPLGVLALAASSSLAEQASARADADGRALALDGAARLADALSRGGNVRSTLASLPAEGAFVLSRDGARESARGPLPPDAALAALVGDRSSGVAASTEGRVAWGRVPGEDFVLVVPVAESAPLARESLALAAGAGLVAGGFAIVGVALAQLAIARPLSELARATARVARGDADARAPRRGTAEIVALGAAFNEMAAEIAAQRRALETANARLDGLLAARTGQLAIAVEDLAALSFTVEHELREPLRSLETVAASLLADDAEVPREEVRAALDAIRRKAARLQRVTRALREFDELSRREPALAEADVRAILDDVAAGLAPILAERGARLELDGEFGTIRADVEALAIAFREVVENGVTFNESPSPRVRVVGGAAGAEATLAFVDNGIGIPPERRDEIFHLFQRLHPAGAYGGGLGLGLALVRRVALMHEGRVTVEAAEGGGTRFVLSLPRGGPRPKPPLPAPARVRES